MARYSHARRYGKPELPTALSKLRNEISVHSEAMKLLLPVFGDTEYPEDIRLKYRFSISAIPYSRQHHEAR
jgi:hypothetical protein